MPVDVNILAQNVGNALVFSRTQWLGEYSRSMYHIPLVYSPH